MIYSKTAASPDHVLDMSTPREIERNFMMLYGKKSANSVCEYSVLLGNISYYGSKMACKCSFVLICYQILDLKVWEVVILGGTEDAAHLWPEVQGGLNVFVLGAGSPPGVVEFEALVTEAGSAVWTTFSGLQGLWGFTELTHHSHTAQIHCVSVSRESKRRGRSYSEAFVRLPVCRFIHVDIVITLGKLCI